MNINEIIIEVLEKNNTAYKHPYNIDYRCDSFDIDFYLPDSRMFIILDQDSYNFELYKDIASLGKVNGYRTTIIPIYKIQNRETLIQWVYHSIYTDVVTV